MGKKSARVLIPTTAEGEWEWVERKVREYAQRHGFTEGRTKEVLDWVREIYQLIPLSIPCSLPADFTETQRAAIESSLAPSLAAFCEKVAGQKHRMLFTMIGMKFGEALDFGPGQQIH